MHIQMRKHLMLLMLAAGALALAAGAASAATFTLDTAIAIDGTEAGNPGVLGEIRPVGTNIVGDPVLLLDGTLDFSTQDVFVVDVVLFSGSTSIDSLGMSVGISPFAPPAGGGALDDFGLAAPDGVATNQFFSFAVIFDFATTTLDAGEQSVRLFASYDTIGSMAEGQTATFMVSSGTDFTVQGLIVPEPGTALLLGSGLLGLASAGRWRQRRQS